MERYEVIESKAWMHKDTGRLVSPYGSCPWMNEAERPQWELVTRGYTIRDNKENTVGLGKMPFANMADAQALADKLNQRMKG